MELASDPTTGAMYASASLAFGMGRTAILVEVDLLQASATLVDFMGSGIGLGGIAIDAAGEMYGIDFWNDQLLSIDKTNARWNSVGSLGFDVGFPGALDFDPDTGVCYLVALDDVTGRAELRTVNVSTGATTLIGEVGTTSPGGGLEPHGAVFGTVSRCVIGVLPATLPPGLVGSPYAETVWAWGGAAPLHVPPGEAGRSRPD